MTERKKWPPDGQGALAKCLPTALSCLCECVENSMEKKELRLALVNGIPEFVTDVAPAGCEKFRFQLCHREVKFGTQQFGQWWMDTRSVYPTRNRPASNFEPIVNFWWQCCLAHGTNRNQGICELFLLASLFRKTRSNGSRRVMLDSIPRAGNRIEQQVITEKLEDLLSRSRGNEKSILAFSRDTGLMLGPPDYAPEVIELYREFTSELFGLAVPRLVIGDDAHALDHVNEIWGTWHSRFGRRGNVHLEKQVIDILSYESRTSVHRCYSHVWDKITNWLATARGCSIASFVFHRLWHLDTFWPSNEHTDKNFHLFHGHILGLHPASAVFVKTTTGKRLIGDWLAVTPIGWELMDNPESPELRRLLYGLYVAVSDYAERHGVANLLRQEQPNQLPSQINMSDVVDGEDGFGRVSRRKNRKKVEE